VEGHGAADVLGERVGRGGAALRVSRCRHDSHALRRQRARNLGSDALVGARDLCQQQSAASRRRGKSGHCAEAGCPRSTQRTTATVSALHQRSAVKCAGSRQGAASRGAAAAMSEAAARRSVAPSDGSAAHTRVVRRGACAHGTRRADTAREPALAVERDTRTSARAVAAPPPARAPAQRGNMQARPPRERAQAAAAAACCALLLWLVTMRTGCDASLRDRAQPRTLDESRPPSRRALRRCCAEACVVAAAQQEREQGRRGTRLSWRISLHVRRSVR
jgi:hypothetical protein